MTLALLFALLAALQAPQAKAAPRDVTYCELARNPQSFHNARVRLTAFLESDFEHFELNDPACVVPQDTDFRLWMGYGGDVPSGAIYSTPGEGFSGPVPKPNKDAAAPLVDDWTYRRFREFLKKHDDVTVRTTIVGTFFAKPRTSPQGLGGFGHFGCCSLFVVERVEEFDDRQPNDLDHTARAGANVAAARETEECRVVSGRMDYWWTPSDAPPQQREADAGPRAWAFDSAERVAREKWRSTYNEEPPNLVRVKRTSALQIFMWRSGNTIRTVVVVRPGFLRYFAVNKKVVWVASWAGTGVCGSL